VLVGALYRADDPELVAKRARARTLLSAGHKGSPQYGSSCWDTWCGYGDRAPVPLRRRRQHRRGSERVREHRLRRAGLRTGGHLRQRAHRSRGAPLHRHAPGRSRPAPARARAGGAHHHEPGAWAGGWVVARPGVTVGEGSTIGAGSVVTADIPPGVAAGGNPCRVRRRLGEGDDRRHEDGGPVSAPPTGPSGRP